MTPFFEGGRGVKANLLRPRPTPWAPEFRLGDTGGGKMWKNDLIGSEAAPGGPPEVREGPRGEGFGLGTKVPSELEKILNSGKKFSTKC